MDKKTLDEIIEAVKRAATEDEVREPRSLIKHFMTTQTECPHCKTEHPFVVCVEDFLPAMMLDHTIGYEYLFLVMGAYTDATIDHANGECEHCNNPELVRVAKIVSAKLESLMPDALHLDTLLQSLIRKHRGEKTQ